MTSGADGNTRRRKSDADALIGQIQRTERRITAEVDALSAKLSVAHVKQRTREQMGAIKNRIVERTSHLATNVRDTGYEAGSASVALVRRHPISAALLGAIFGWLSWLIIRPRMPAARQRMAERTSSLRENLSERTAATRGSVREAGEGARQRATGAVRRTRSGVRRAAEGTRDAYASRPLVMVGLMAAVGLGVGLLLPASRRESRTFEPYRERAKERVTEAGERARRVVSDSARAGMSAARDTAKREVRHGSRE